MTIYKKIKVPNEGAMIKKDSHNNLVVPDDVVIPFIEGDGIGVDITPVMIKVVDSAVEKAYAGRRRIRWMEIYAGEKAMHVYEEKSALPDETLEAIRQFGVAIKGPLTTPVGGGFRSLNVALRQKLDLFVCLRPIRYFRGTPSVMKEPENTHMEIFRENSEDIYAGIEFQAGEKNTKKLIDFLQKELGVTEILFPNMAGIGVKPVSKEGTVRLVRKAIEYAINHHRPTVTLVHKGNIMKYTEGAFKEWGYELAVEEFDATPVDGGPWHVLKNPNTGEDIIVKDVIADAFLQQILLRPKEYDVIATLNLNGDYISDALAAQVGGIGIAPGANLSNDYAVFEATHGTAPKYAGQDKVNPGSLILSAEMMLRHLGWVESADLVIKGLEKAIQSKNVTYDFARLMDSANELSCSGFGEAMIRHF